jgi:hypothetical protein
MPYFRFYKGFITGRIKTKRNEKKPIDITLVIIVFVLSLVIGFSGGSNVFVGQGKWRQSA